MATRLAIGESREIVVTRLLSCRDLDDVERLGSATNLVKALFGDKGTKPVVEAFGDALVTALSRSRASEASMSSVCLAIASTELLDPTRLCAVLRLDDFGLELMSPHEIDSVADDLKRTIANFRDSRRRLALITSAFEECRDWAKAHNDADGVVEEIERSVTKTLEMIGDPADFTAPGMTRTEVLMMRIEWSIQRFLAEEQLLAHLIACGRPLLLVGDGDNREHMPLSSEHMLRERATAYLLALRTFDRILSRITIFQEPGKKTAEFVFQLHAGAMQSLLRQGKRLCRLAALPPTDHKNLEKTVTWLEPAVLYRGLRTSVSVTSPIVPALQRPVPKRRVSDAVAELASFVRAGATLPEKPKDWHALIVGSLSPYFRGPTGIVKAPAWVPLVNETVLDPHQLIVRAPKDMRELAEWGAYMGNCVHSYFGDDVNDGTRVILGLFLPTGELRYNVGVHASSGEVWEVNSRFNSNDIDPGVDASVRALITRSVTAIRLSANTPERLDFEDLVSQRNRRATTRAPSARRGSVWSKGEAKAIGDIVRDVDVDSSPWADAVRSIETSASGSWSEALARFRRLSDRAQHERLDDVLRGPDKIWPLLATHPLEALGPGSTVGRVELNADQAKSLSLVVNGADDAALRSTKRLLDDPTIAAAWECSRLATSLRTRFARLAIEHPDWIVPMLRADDSGEARWVAVLLWTGARDRGGSLPGMRTVPVNFPSSAMADRAWTLLPRFDDRPRPDVPERSAVHADSPNSREEQQRFEDSDWAIRRAELGLDVARCPQRWLAR